MNLGTDFIHRTKQWWAAKAGFLISLLCCYLAFSGVDAIEGIPLLLWALIAIFGLGTLGHVLNDWTDIEEDRLAGKSNTMAQVPVWARWLILASTLVISTLPWVFGFDYNSLILSLVVGEVLLFSLYSLKPVRLKRFPIVAVCLDALYAYVNPSLFLWFSFQLTLGHQLSGLLTLGLIGWTFSFGLRQILNHHVVDAANDRESNTPNLANSHGANSIMQLLRKVLIPLEILFCLSFLNHITFVNPFLGIGLLLAYWLIILTRTSRRYPFVQIRFGKLAFDGFYTVWIGLISIVYLCSQDLTYLAVLPIFILLFTNTFSHPLFQVLPVRFSTLVITMISWPFQMASLIFNWSLYYFRKWVLRWPEERNWGEHYAKRKEEIRLNEKGNIAIFNQNFAKYSETFVEGQLRSLDYRTFYYYGWPKPLIEREAGHLIDSNVYVRQLKYSVRQILGLDLEQFEDDRIAESLVSNNVALIIAHFGPMGSKLLNVSQNTGIPILVVFHGYDAWNKGQLADYSQAYHQLFKQASGLIGVSKDICEQLEELGCPSEKITYLPAYMNPAFFKEQNLYPSEPTFLSVGRFSRTKSPHLLLLSFAQVLNEIPNAKLTMIGTDDGEGLFEACQILVRSLGIENSVNFKGRANAEEVLHEMKNNTVFVQHSVTTPIDGDKEGTPVGIMEAMAIGMPIIATKHGGIAELIENEETGVLIEEYDIKSMAKEMVNLAGNAEKRRQLGNNAKKWITENELIYSSLQKFSNIIDKHKLKQ